MTVCLDEANKQANREVVNVSCADNLEGAAIVANLLQPEIVKVSYADSLGCGDDFGGIEIMTDSTQPEISYEFLGAKGIHKKCSTEFKMLQAETAEINVKLDKILRVLQGQRNADEVSIDKGCASSSTVDNNIQLCAFKFPLTTIDETRQLESALREPTFRKELKKMVFRNIGKNDGEVDGHYLNKMGNQMFTDALLTLYTYKGISRGGAHKENFGELKNIILLFQSLLCDVCPIFDLKRTEKYIQTKLLRHSGSRMKRL